MQIQIRWLLMEQTVQFSLFTVLSNVFWESKTRQLTFQLIQSIAADVLQSALYDYHGSQSMGQHIWFRHLLHIEKNLGCMMEDDQSQLPSMQRVKSKYMYPLSLASKSIYSGLQIRVCIGKLFSLFSSKTYVVGTQKNRLNETVLLSTQNTCLNWLVRK